MSRCSQQNAHPRLRCQKNIKFLALSATNRYVSSLRHSSRRPGSSACQPQFWRLAEELSEAEALWLTTPSRYITKPCALTVSATVRPSRFSFCRLLIPHTFFCRCMAKLTVILIFFYLLIPSSSTFRCRGDPREPSTSLYPLLSFPPLSMLLLSFLSPLVTLPSMFSLASFQFLLLHTLF